MIKHLKKLQRQLWIVHVIVVSSVLYIGNRTVFLLLSSQYEAVPLLEKITASFLQTVDEISDFSFHFSFAMKPLMGSGILVLAYGLFVLYKTFDEKKIRPGEEYGSARWGKYRDIKAFLAKKKDFNILLTKTESLSLSGRMKITGKDNFNRNKNVVVVGGAGSGKTLFYVKPNLMQMHSSYVVSDSKGLLLMETGKMFEEAGYKIKVFDLINRRDTHHYNPFNYIKTEDDILKIVNNLIKNTSNPDKKGGDDFWEKA